MYSRAASVKRVKTRARKLRRAWRHAHLRTRSWRQRVVRPRTDEKHSRRAFRLRNRCLGFSAYGHHRRRLRAAAAAPFTGRDRMGNGRPVGRRPHAQTSRRTGRRVKSPRRAHPNRTATRTPTGADARAHEICTYVITLYRAYLSFYRRCGCPHARAQRDRNIISSRSSRIPRGLQCRRRR